MTDFETGVMVGMLLSPETGEKPQPEPEEWTPPADWPVVPEPNKYEAYLLVDITDVSTSTNQELSIIFTNPLDAKPGYGPITYDWGDGTVDSFDDSKWDNLAGYHQYTNIGKYVVKIVVTKTSCFLQQIRPYYTSSKVLIAKLGDEIVINSGSSSHIQRAFNNQSRLQYVKFGGKGGLAYNGTFAGNSVLQKVDITIPPTIITQNTFSSCYNLRNFDFSEVTKIESNGISCSGFEKLYLPKCKSIENNALSQNYNLKQINLPLCESVGTQAIFQNYGITKLSLPKCTSVSDNGMSYNWFLKEINLPLCESIGERGMYNNYSLKSITVADGCIFGTNCFENCYMLYPKPDGTT